MLVAPSGVVDLVQRGGRLEKDSAGVAPRDCEGGRKLTDDAEGFSRRRAFGHYPQRGGGIPCPHTDPSVEDREVVRDAFPVCPLPTSPSLARDRRQLAIEFTCAAARSGSALRNGGPIEPAIGENITQHKGG